MSDEQAVQEESNAQVQWNEQDSEVEVIVDDGTTEEEGVPEEFKGVGKADIIRRLQEIEKKAGEATTLNQTLQGLTAATAKMADQKLVVQAPQPAPAAPAKPLTLDEMREKFGEKFTMDPIGTVMELQEQKMSPQLAQMASGNLQLARRVLELDPEKGPTFKRFSQEIDSLVASAPPEVKANPMIYEEAYRRVVSVNIDKIINERVESTVAAKLEEAKKAAPPPGAPRPPAFAEGRGVPAPKKVTVRIKPEELERMKRMGIDPRDYADVLGGAK